MNKNTSGAALVLIIAAAGLVHDKPWAWSLAAITCALAFLAEDREMDTLPAVVVAFFAAAASWGTIIAAFIALHL